jgi:hypothetical protein
MPKWDASELVFLNESAANERTSDRKRGWSPRGLTCSTSVLVKRLERWSILLALTIDSYLDFVTDHKVNVLRGHLLPFVMPEVYIVEE